MSCSSTKQKTQLAKAKIIHLCYFVTLSGDMTWPESAMCHLSLSAHHLLTQFLFQIVTESISIQAQIKLSCEYSHHLCFEGLYITSCANSNESSFLSLSPSDDVPHRNAPFERLCLSPRLYKCNGHNHCYITQWLLSWFYLIILVRNDEK